MMNLKQIIIKLLLFILFIAPLKTFPNDTKIICKGKYGGGPHTVEVKGNGSKFVNIEIRTYFPNGKLAGEIKKYTAKLVATSKNKPLFIENAKTTIDSRSYLYVSESGYSRLFNIGSNGKWLAAASPNDISANYFLGKCKSKQ